MSFYNPLLYGKVKADSKGSRKINSAFLLEQIYLLVIALYILKAFFDTTLFRLFWTPNYEKILRVSVCIIVFLKLRCFKPYVRSGLLLGVLTLVVFKFSWLSTGYTFLLDIALIIIGSVDVPYKKILKTGFWTGLCVLLLAMLGSSVGCIPDLIYVDDGQFKHSFGIVYPTDFAAHIVYLFLTGWVLYGKRARILPAILALGLCLFTYSMTGAKCSAIVLFGASICSLYVFLTEKFENQIQMVNQVTKIIEKILVYIFLICALAMIVLTLLYSAENPIMDKINSLITGRLHLGKNAIERYGIKLFGTAFPQVGFGGTTAWSWVQEYTFVDCSYVMLLVRYGLSVLVITCAQTIYMGRRAIKYKQRRILLASALVAVHSMIEHHLPEIAYNLFLLLPFARYDLDEENECNEPAAVVKARYIKGIIWFCFSILIVLVLPKFVSYIETIVDLLQLDVYENHIWFVAIMLGCMLWVGIFVNLVIRVVVSIVTNVSFCRLVPLGMIALFMIFLVAFSKGEATIHRGQIECSNLLEKDRAIIEMLGSDSSTGKIYVDYIPEVYAREFGGISHNVFSAEGLATCNNVTLISKDECELRALIAAGYEYGELASGSAVYTNSEEAKELLTKSGIKLSNYYSKQRLINLNDAAQANGLHMNTDDSLSLSGLTGEFLHGPKDTICKGILQIRYTLRLVSNPYAETNIATVKVYSDLRTHIWQEDDIQLTNFDENGMGNFVVECTLPFDCPYVEFSLSVPENIVLEVYKISYGKIEK